MNNFYGNNKSFAYFEGWYAKFQNRDSVLGLVWAFHVDENQQKKVSLQLNTKDDSYVISYPISAFKVSKKHFYIKIGNCILNEQGLSLNIKGVDDDNKALSVEGRLAFSTFNKPKYPLMGPFNLLANLECYHDVISLYHTINGSIKINGKLYSYQNDLGYIEKDRGSSFPKSYLWSSCLYEDISVMVAIAEVPIATYCFEGLLGCIFYQQKEYRLATYLGARVTKKTAELVIIKQGRYTLEMRVIDNSYANKLKAPVNGAMSATVYESVQATLRYSFYEHQTLLFDFISSKASYEYFNETAKLK